MLYDILRTNSLDIIFYVCIWLMYFQVPLPFHKHFVGFLLAANMTDRKSVV